MTSKDATGGDTYFSILIKVEKHNYNDIDISWKIKTCDRS